MSDFGNSYREIPLCIVIGSFLMTILLDFMSLPFDVLFWSLKPTALALLYQVMYLPNRIGMGTAFLIGLLVDVGTVTSLGLHALSRTVMVFFALCHHCQIMLYSHVMQILVAPALLLCDQTVLMMARLFLNRQTITSQSFITPIVGALLQFLFSQLTQMIVNFRRIRR